MTEMADNLPELDFGFAFNDSNYSDWVLRIEIAADSSESKSDGQGCSTIADWIWRRENGDEHQTVQNDLSMGSTVVISVETVHISSPILAAKSPFFNKLFSNGMKESKEKHVTLRIKSSEKYAFMDLLYFMYNNTLKTITPTGLLDVLVAADKYEVASCMRYCSHLLLNFPMTSESALFYVDFPSSVSTASAVRPLTDAAIAFLALQDINKYQEEVMNLPLALFEAVLSSDNLQVASEDAVFDFALRWSRAHYPKLEERREIIGSRICKLIRFPYMTCQKLRKVMNCNDIDPKPSSMLVLEALFFKSEAPSQKALLSKESSRRYTERAYKYRLVKVIEYELPHQRCVVYLDLKKEECRSLFPSGQVFTQAFQFGGQSFFLSTHCNMDQQNSFHCFGMFLGMQEKGLPSFSVDYEYSAWQKPQEKFVVKSKGKLKFIGGKALGHRNLFRIPWPLFIADDSQFFINGFLHIKAELTIRDWD